MKIVSDASWMKRGMSLLWDNSALSRLITPGEAIPLRKFLCLTEDWPDDLPSAQGNAVVVVGLEAALDCLAFEDAESWLESCIRPSLLSFQGHYQGQAGLHFWLPGGRKRIVPSFASSNYAWRCASPAQGNLPLGRLLWSGAESEALRIVEPGSRDAEGLSWWGLHHRRVS